MKPLLVCLIGCGRVAKSHMDGAEQIPKDIEVVAVINRTIEKAKKFQKEYSVDYAFSSLKEALENVEFDAVDLCLPNHLHREFTIECAKAGKHVLVEKPMANTVSESQDMIDIAKKHNVKLMVGQSRRFFNSVFKSKEIVEKREIGDLISISANLFAYLQSPPTDWWRELKKAGGLIIPIWGSHIIDYVLWMFKEKPIRVYCEGFSVNPEWEGEDEVTLIIGFPKNKYATIKMSWNTRLNDISWEGTGKMLSSSDIIYERYIQCKKGTLKLEDETVLSLNGRIISEDDKSLSNFARQFIEFKNAILEDREPITSGGKIIDVIRIQQAALISAKKHKVIKL